MILLLLVIGFMLSWLSHTIHERIEETVDLICEANAWPEASGLKLLVLRSVADEASGILIAMQFSAWITRKLSRVASWPWNILRRSLKYIDSEGRLTLN
jgi:hypothetical protein